MCKGNKTRVETGLGGVYIQFGPSTIHCHTATLEGPPHLPLPTWIHVMYVVNDFYGSSDDFAAPLPTHIAGHTPVKEQDWCHCRMLIVFKRCLLGFVRDISYSRR
jgi:hypothetical protein